MARVIGHVDLDYFYAQVEEVENPSLKGTPVTVCVFSGRTEDSGAVATANYQARALGVRSGMPIVLAKKKLEGTKAAIIRMDHAKYETVSQRIMELLEGMVDVLEPTGIDEAFFDISNSTGGDFAKAKKTAESIKQRILNAEHLTCSIGIGRSKIVAKMGSDSSKPDGLTIILPSETEGFLFPLPVGRLYGVGPKTQASLEAIGIKTVKELAHADPTELERGLGRKFAEYLVAASKGDDSDQVVADAEPTQFGRIVTLKRDTKDPDEIALQLAEAITDVHHKLTTAGKTFRTVAAIVIMTDLSMKTKSKSFETPIDDLNIIRETSRELFNELGRTAPRDFRRAGVRVSGLAESENQTSLSEYLAR